MAINLASKYSDQIAEVFTRASFIKGKTAETYDLTGVKTLKVYTPITVEEVDYDRDGGLKRYGDVTEMQDVVQELTMTQDKAFTLTIDKGNNLDQNLVKNAADMLRLQLNEKSTPAADKYAFKRFVTMAGSIVESAKPTKANIISKIADASQELDDALVPDDNRYLYLTSEMYKLVCTSDEFAGVDVLARQSIAKGVCGEVFGMNVVRVPKSYLPEDVYFLVAHKDAVLMPYKIADAKVHEDPVGVSGCPNRLRCKKRVEAFPLLSAHARAWMALRLWKSPTGSFWKQYSIFLCKINSFLPKKVFFVVRYHHI